MRRRFAMLSFVTVISLILLTPVPVSADVPVSAEAFDDPDRRVLVIGLDGLVPEAVDSPWLPNINTLFESDQGWLMEAYTEDLTFSGPSWSSILNGVHRDLHGVTTNSYDGHDFTDWPSFLKRAKEHRPERYTAAFVTWPLLRNNFQTPDGDRDGVDRLTYYNSHEEEGDERVTRELVDLLEQGDPSVIFYYQNDIDAAGHGYGFYMERREYREQVRKTDERVGRVLEALRDRPGVQSGEEEWLILLVTDHGGVGTGHSGNLLRQRSIPLIVSGPTLHKLDPPPFPVRNVDVSRTALDWLGLLGEELEELDGHNWLTAAQEYPKPTPAYGKNLVFNGSGELNRGFGDPEFDQVPTGWRTQEYTGQAAGHRSMTLFRPSDCLLYRDAEGTESEYCDTSLFRGGSEGERSIMTQRIGVERFSRAVDSREVAYEAEAWLGRDGEDRARFRIRFIDREGETIGTAVLQSEAPEDSGGLRVLTQTIETGVVPIGTRTLEFQLEAISTSEEEGVRAYADRLQVKLAAADR